MGEVVDPGETRFAILDTSVEEISNVSISGLSGATHMYNIAILTYVSRS